MRPRRHDLLALAMILFLLVFEVTLLGTPYRFYFNDVFSRGVGWAVLRVGGVVASLSILALIFRATFAATWAWRIGAALVFGLVVALEYGYVNATGGFLNAHDIRVALADSINRGPMIQLHWSRLALVPAGVYAVLLALGGPPRAQGHVRRLAAALGLALTLHSTYAAAIYIRGDEDEGLREELAPPSLSPQAFLRSTTMLVWNRTSRWYFQAQYGGREPVSLNTDIAPTRHVVLVVDESIRGDHLSVNGYARSTTPWLDEMARAGKVANWGVASSATWTSNDSVLCMLTGVTSLPDRARRTLTAPTLFQFARAMGYRTHLFDGGARQLRFGFDFDDLRAIDDWSTRDRFGNDTETDFRIAREVARLLESPHGQFIVVLKRGNHVPYEGNYPATHSTWLPDDRHWQPSDPEDISFVNTYDNAIRYNVDTFLQLLLGGRSDPDRTVLVYTSDHGQLLTDARAPGLARRLTWGEVAVPLLMMGAVPPVDTGYRASHANVTATILDLLLVPDAARPDGYARSLLRARASNHDPRLVFSGAFFGRGSFLVQDFDQLALEHAMTTGTSGR